MDANEGGTVTAEAAASEADMVFTSMDADDDGSLTVDEFMSVLMVRKMVLKQTVRPQCRPARPHALTRWTATPMGPFPKPRFTVLSRAGASFTPSPTIVSGPFLRSFRTSSTF